MITQFIQSILYVARPGGVRKSEDGGQSWYEASEGLPSDHSPDALVIDPMTPTNLYAGVTVFDPSTGQFSGRIFKTTDGAVDVNLRADLGRDPTTATYNLTWEFSGCPGFSDCSQVIDARWRR